MKYLKILGLAVTAASALMAFAGASSASADVFCTTTTTPCNAKVTTLEFNQVTGTQAILETEFLTIKCGKLTIDGTVTSQGAGHDIEGVNNTKEFTFTECNCPITTLKGGTFTAQRIGTTENATYSSSGAEFTLTCNTIFGPVHCIYLTQNTDLGELVGGSPAKLVVKEANLPRLSTSSLCSGLAKLTATVELTNHTALYVEPE